MSLQSVLFPFNMRHYIHSGSSWQWDKNTAKTRKADSWLVMLSEKDLDQNGDMQKINKQNMDREACWPTAHEVAKSLTQLSDCARKINRNLNSSWATRRGRSYTLWQLYLQGKKKDLLSWQGLSPWTTMTHYISPPDLLFPPIKVFSFPCSAETCTWFPVFADTELLIPNKPIFAREIFSGLSVSGQQ